MRVLVLLLLLLLFRLLGIDRGATASVMVWFGTRNVDAARSLWLQLCVEMVEHAVDGRFSVHWARRISFYEDRGSGLLGYGGIEDAICLSRLR